MTSNKYIDPLTSSRCLLFVLIMIMKLALMYVHIIDDGRSMMSMVLGISLLGSLMPRTVDSCSASSEEEFMPAVKILLSFSYVLQRYCFTQGTLQCWLHLSCCYSYYLYLASKSDTATDITLPQALCLLRVNR